MENSPLHVFQLHQFPKRSFQWKNLPHWKTTAPVVFFFFRCLGGNFIRIFKYFFDFLFLFLPTFLRALEGCFVWDMYIYIYLNTDIYIYVSIYIPCFFSLGPLFGCLLPILFCTTKKHSTRGGGPSILAALRFRRFDRCTGANEAEASTIETMRIGEKTAGRGMGERKWTQRLKMKTIIYIWSIWEIWRLICIL